MPTAVQLARFTPASMVVLYDQSLTADAASFDVQDIPSGYRNLHIILTGRSTRNLADDSARIQFNGDTGSNYDYQYTWGSGTSGTASAAAAYAQTGLDVMEVPAATAPSDNFGMYVFEVPHYDSTAFRKQIMHRGGAPTVSSGAGYYSESPAGLWRSTAAINRIKIAPNNGNWKAGSRLTIYGLGGAHAPSFLPGTQLDYVEITSPVTISATTAAGANTCITGNAVTYDGATRICVESFSPYVATGTSSQSSVTVVLFDGSSQVGILTFHGRGDGTRDDVSPHFARRLLTPSAGSHTYSIRAYRGTSNGSFNAGAGGDDAFLPAYIRVTAA